MLPLPFAVNYSSAKSTTKQLRAHAEDLGVLCRGFIIRDLPDMAWGSAMAAAHYGRVALWWEERERDMGDIH